MKLKKHDVLFAGSGETKTEIGKSAAVLYSKPVYAGGDIVILRPTKESSEFLGYHLNSTFVNNQKAINFVFFIINIIIFIYSI